MSLKKYKVGKQLAVQLVMLNQREFKSFNLLLSIWYQEYKLEGGTKIELLKLEIFKTKDPGFQTEKNTDFF